MLQKRLLQYTVQVVKQLPSLLFPSRSLSYSAVHCQPFYFRFPSRQTLAATALSALVSELWQTFDASSVVSGQLPKQQEMLSDACSVSCRPHAIRFCHMSDAFSVVLQARCLLKCASRYRPSDLLSAAEPPPKQQHISALAACASKHQVFQQMQAPAFSCIRFRADPSSNASSVAPSVGLS